MKQLLGLVLSLCVLALAPAAQAADCGATSLCPSTPYYGGCSQPTVEQKSLFRVSDRTPDDGDRLVFKWKRGEATAKAEFGTPGTDTDYAVCVYDGESLVAEICAPAASLCDERECWKETAKGFKYAEVDGLGGKLRLVLKSGVSAKAQVKVIASGALSATPALPLALPTVVRVVNNSGACWDAAFGAPARSNQAGKFKDKSDPPSVTQPVGGPAPLVSAHRGGAAYAPEDTMVAYRNAARLGVDDFEADTQLTSDGVLVIIHDDTLDRTTDCSGAVVNMTYAALQACDAAYWFSPGQPVTSPDAGLPHPLRGQGVRIPTAAEVFAYAAELGPNGPTVTIEIKNIPGEEGFIPDCIAAADALVAEVQASGIQDRIVVQSFWPACVDNVKASDPTIRTLFLTTTTTGQTAFQNLAYTTANGHDISSPNFDAPDFDQSFVDAVHTAGKQVIPYTADTLANIQALSGLGVDGIITNFPACQLSLQGRTVPASLLTPDAGVDTGLAVCKP